MNDILNRVLDNYDLKIGRVNLIYEVLQCVDLETWYDEWDRLVGTIDG